MNKIKKIIAVQANNLESINILTDTTFLLCLEAQRRGFKIFWYQTSSLSLNNKKVSAKGNFVNLFENRKNFYFKSKKIEFNLLKSKYLLIRQNPPLNIEYINSTLYLEKLIPKVKVINNPISVRNMSEKFYSSKFFKYMPPTIYTKDIEQIKRFYDKYKKIVIKPINGYAGEGVKLIDKKIIKKKLSSYLSRHGHVMVQKFLPAVKNGDKRVFIIKGKVYGAIRRVPPQGSILSNISQGGYAIKTNLNSTQNKISKIIAKDLYKNNVYFAGIDFVSNYIIGDINITSPTGLTQFKELTGKNLAKNFWDNLDN